MIEYINNTIFNNVQQIGIVTCNIILNLKHILVIVIFFKIYILQCNVFVYEIQNLFFIIININSHKSYC